MGLDGVELIMALEEEFEIDIEDESVSELVCVVDIVDYIYFKVRKRKSENLPKEVAEERVIKAVREICESRRESVSWTMQTELRSIFDTDKRIKEWEALRQALQIGTYRWPSLRRSLWLSAVIITFPFLVSILIPEDFFYLYFASLAPLFLMILFFRITRRYKYCFPVKLKNLNDVVNIYFKGARHREYTYENVRSRIKEIIVEQLGVSEEDVTDNAHLIHDLGMD